MTHHTSLRECRIAVLCHGIYSSMVQLPTVIFPGGLADFTRKKKIAVVTDSPETDDACTNTPSKAWSELGGSVLQSNGFLRKSTPLHE